MTRYELAACAACGGSRATLIADGAALRDELEQLWAFHTRRVRGDTPPERLLDRAAFSQRPPLQLVRCDACGLIYRNPRERADELIETYAEDDVADTVLDALRATQMKSYRAQARRLSRTCGGAAGQGLEIGSYVGGFLAAAAEQGWRFRGVDVNERAVNAARRHGDDVQLGTIDDVAADQRFDAICFWNCFDQLPDPLAGARAARERLRTGGIVAIRVPSGEFYQRWRQRLRSPLRGIARAVLAHSNLLGFPYRHGFSAASLELLLGRCGFRVEHVAGDALVPTADRHTRRWARVEERLIRTALRSVPARRSPWLEIHARALPP